MSEERIDDKLCSSNRSQAVEGGVITSATMTAAEVTRMGDNEEALNSAEHNDSSHNFNEDERALSYRRLERSLDNDVFLASINSTDDSSGSLKLAHKTSHNPADVDRYVNDAERDNATARVASKQSHNICSTVSDFYCHLKRIAEEDEQETSFEAIKLYGRFGFLFSDT